MALPSGPQHPFWRGRTDDEARPQLADGSLIARLLSSTPSREAPTFVPDSLASEVVTPEAVEFGDPVVSFIRLAPARPAPRHLVGLPIDHRRKPRVIRLHEPHLDRRATATDKFDHWRRWMAASKRKELA